MENSVINGRYRILQQIGVGGFGLTFLGEDLHFSQRPKCVVKMLKPQNSDPQNWQLAARLFQQEAEILHNLGRHPQIPALVAHFSERGNFFLVQEFIEGHTLDKEFLGGKRYNQQEVIQMLGQTLEILSFVHSQKVIHRDVKPANIIRRVSDGSLFLIDFGAVKQVNRTPSQTADNYATAATVAIGSHGYMPVEQMAGSPNFSSDLYALGLVAIEGLTGVKPLEIPKDARTGEFLWANRIQLAPSVENFITKLIRYDCRQRYFSAKEALADCNSIASHVGFFNSGRQVSVPVIVQPLRTRHNLPTHVAQPLQTAPEIPPTVIVSPQNAMHFNRQIHQTAPPSFEERADAESYKGLKRIALGFGSFVVLMLILQFVGVGLNSSVSTPNARTETEAEKLEKARDETYRQQTELSRIKSQTSNIDVYKEAVKQADEAFAKQDSATTKYDWEQISSKYRRAYLLMASIEESHPRYTEAQVRMNDYKSKADWANKKISSAQETPVLSNSSANSGDTRN